MSLAKQAEKLRLNPDNLKKLREQGGMNAVRDKLLHTANTAKSKLFFSVPKAQNATVVADRARDAFLSIGGDKSLIKDKTFEATKPFVHRLKKAASIKTATGSFQDMASSFYGGFHPDKFKRAVVESAGKTVGALGVGALGYGAVKGIQALTHRKGKGFEGMQAHAGPDFHELPDAQKKLAKKYYDTITTHAPSLTKDHIAAWNHVWHFLANPSTHGAPSIEQFRKSEAAKPKLLGK